MSSRYHGSSKTETRSGAAHRQTGDFQRNIDTILSINTVITLRDGSELPQCWEWSVKHLRQYVSDRMVLFTKIKGVDTKLRPFVEEVARKIILDCIDKKRPYATDESNVLITIIVPYHDGALVPINDIFSALGWFISMTDLRKGSASDCLRGHFQRLVHYTRLCLTLAEYLKVDLAKTHLLISANYARLTTKDKFKEMASLSSSLPKTKKKNGYGGHKEAARLLRVQSTLDNGHDQHIESRNLNVANGQLFGHCAETLTILSQMTKGSKDWIYVWGTALNVKSLQGPFAGYDFYKTGSAYTPACCNCRVIFRRSNATYMDIVSLELQGTLPEGYTMDEAWKQLIPCQKCGNFIDPKSSEKCLDGCSSYWCGGDEHNCRQDEDEAHSRHCPKRHSQSVPSGLQAVAGHPPRAVAESYHYTPIHVRGAISPYASQDAKTLERQMANLSLAAPSHSQHAPSAYTPAQTLPARKRSNSIHAPQPMTCYPPVQNMPATGRKRSNSIHAPQPMMYCPPTQPVTGRMHSNSIHAPSSKALGKRPEQAPVAMMPNMPVTFNPLPPAFGQTSQHSPLPMTRHASSSVAHPPPMAPGMYGSMSVPGSSAVNYPYNMSVAPGYVPPSQAPNVYNADAGPSRPSQRSLMQAAQAFNISSEEYRKRYYGG